MPDLAAAGSQRWLQLAVNAQRRLVDEPLVGAWVAAPTHPSNGSARYTLVAIGNSRIWMR